MAGDPITCMIPTHNRPRFLRRLLHFYGCLNPGYPFLVMDSSDRRNAAENVAIVNAMPAEMRISYRHSDANVIDKCVQGIESIQTPFIVLCADDDVLFPDAVRSCVSFLEQHPSYSSAMGRTAQLNPTLPVRCCRVLKGYSIENESPFDRCRALANNWFTNFYAVYRQQTLFDIFQITASSTDSLVNYHIPEMMLSQLSALRGPIRVLPIMYSLMERHNTNAGAAMRVGVRPQAEPLYQRFRTALLEQLTAAGTGRVAAEQFIDTAYGYFREPSLAVRRRRRPLYDRMGHWGHGALEMFGLVQAEGNQHRRFIRADDLVGCEAVWQLAVQLMKDFPLGFDADKPLLERCA